MVHDDEPRPNGEEITRRQFLKLAGTAAAGVALAEVSGLFWVEEGLAAIPVSGGYLLVDTKKCAGCTSCMLACSLVHEGTSSQSLARIQILQDPYANYPSDIALSQCRQCVDPKCVEACPTGALAADPKNGNVRMVDEAKCIGCRRCFGACPFIPSRAVFDFEHNHGQKCDLCANAPYWDEKGGPDGRQACVEVCPMDAIKFTKTLPAQYDANLRGPGWKALGLPTD